ncbi:MAG: trigger factor [Candidatus Hydrogenedens sp.]|jgi:trigger factor|nr:trigger factor [Candidatus Hydrogenedens sp.]
MTEKDNDAVETPEQESAPEVSEIEETTDLDTADLSVDAEMGDDEFEWKEPPVFEIEHKEDCLCEIKVTIPAANIVSTLDIIYKEMNDGVQVPGFRRGKAPRKLLEKRLGKYAHSTAIEQLTDAAAKKLMRDHELRPVSEAEVTGLEDKDQLDDKEDLVYTVSFEVAGTCELADLSTIELERPEYEVDEEAVEAQINNMRTRFGRYEPLEEGVAEDGDQLVIDFKGTVDGEEFEGGSAEAYPYILGSKRFYASMEEAMLGKKAGDQVTAEVTFEEDYMSAEVAGKTAQFEISINEIKRRVLPELDDEFAKKAGHESMEIMRETVKKRMSETADDQLDQMLEEQAMGKLVEASSFTLPKGQIQQFVEMERNSIYGRMLEQNVSAEEMEREADNVDEAAQKQGLFNLKAMYVVDALSEQEKIEITEEDFEDYTRQFIQGEDTQMLEAYRAYFKSDEMRSTTAHRILYNKAMKTAVAKCQIKILSEEEMKKAEEDAKEKEAVEEEKEDA